MTATLISEQQRETSKKRNFSLKEDSNECGRRTGESGEGGLGEKEAAEGVAAESRKK